MYKPFKISKPKLEWRWHIIDGEETLQVRNIFQPSNASFTGMDTSIWTTVYGFSDDPNSYNLSHATWPDAAVSDDYITEHGSSSTFGNLTIQYAQVENDATSGNYRQLQVDLSSANGVGWSDNANTNTNRLFVYSGNINDEDLAGGKSSSWPTLIRNSDDNVTQFNVSGGEGDAPYFQFIDKNGQVPDFNSIYLFPGKTYEFIASGVSNIHPFMVGES